MIAKNIRIKGNNTKTHARFSTPVLHIRFNIQVQNKTYTNCTANIKETLVTLQDKLPKQYILDDPIFWNEANAKKIKDITK